MSERLAQGILLVEEVLLRSGDIRRKVARFLLTDALDDEVAHALAEEVCTAALGDRVPCPRCGSMVFPGLLCWGCEDWTAPAGGQKTGPAWPSAGGSEV